ncbi:MAG: hypothetical protein OES20_12530 [Gammaproteobacteria bacterium]|nr:hypothetical protein [Gammaproteobacteria bacterium]MDH3859242.1 hypothetical protein [Gammaproteobacteria bacterium]
MIKNALSVMPTRPIVYIVPAIVILVMSFYYGDIYAKCRGNKQFRASLNELLVATDVSGQFRLADATDFGWDRVRVVTNFKPEASGSECPFDWNWPRGERDSLIASGLLTVLIFVRRGAIVNYQELRDDEVAFHGADASLSPQAAVFSIGANPDHSGGVKLTLNNPE